MTAYAFLIASGESGRLSFALVAEGETAEFVGRDGDQNVPDSADIDRLTEIMEWTPDSPGAWLDFLVMRYPRAEITSIEAESLDEARASAIEIITEDPTVGSDVIADSRSTVAADAWDDLMETHPDFIDSLAEGSEGADDDDDEAEVEDPSTDPMLLWMIQAHGPIDPEGPNGWMVRALDGEEIPEGSYISFGPPAEEPSAEPTEE